MNPQQLLHQQHLKRLRSRQTWQELRASDCRPLAFDAGQAVVTLGACVIGAGVLLAGLGDGCQR